MVQLLWEVLLCDVTMSQHTEGHTVMSTGHRVVGHIQMHNYQCVCVCGGGGGDAATDHAVEKWDLMESSRR